MSGRGAALAVAEAPDRAPRRRFAPGRGLRGLLLALAGLGGLLLLWFTATEVLAPAGGMARRFSPLATAASLPDLFTQFDLPANVAASLGRVLVGLVAAILVGVPLGLAVGSSRALDAALSPVLQLLRMTSPLSWMPIAVMAFGLGDGAIDVLLASAATWPIALNTAAGVRALDTRWLLLGRSLSATGWETLRHIVLPGIVGHVLTGIRLAIGISWIVLVPCEMLGVSTGLGYLVLNTRDALAYPELMGVVLTIGVLGFLLDGSARGLSRLWSRG